MAVKFQQSVQATTPPVRENTELVEVKSYDMVQDRESMNALVGSSEIDQLVSQIDIGNTETIVTFGAKAAEEISKASDVVLNSMNMSQINDSGEMLNTLSRIMSKFDIEEIKEDKGFFGKFLGNSKKRLEKILGKYNTMGDQIDKIYVQLRKYEDEIKKSNRTLDEMFDANVDYYHELVKYILAGEQGCQEIRDYIEVRKQDYENSGDSAIQFEIQNLEQSLQMLEQRTMDLRTAENVAMQSVPLIKTMEYSNANLVRKINSAFIITLPVFKQALAQAVLLKRQKIQAESMAALDQRTNEMLKKNAQNSAAQMAQIARLTSNSSIQVETLEESWQTIMNGIEETRRIQEESSQKREIDKQKLIAMKEEFQKQGLK